MITRRRLTAERMDDPEADPAELAQSLGFIRLVNARLGGAAAAIGQFKRWARTWPQGRPMRIIDVGTGSADIPLAIVRWATLAGHDVQITAVDLHETTLQLARQHVGHDTRIELEQADALKLMDRFKPGEFDYAHAGMFLHHLQDIEVLTVLRIMDRLTTRGLIWNDLIRGFAGRLGVRLLTSRLMNVPDMAKHDGRVSVEAGFTRQEALDLAQRASLQRIEYRRHMLHRFTLTSTKVHAEEIE